MPLSDQQEAMWQQLTHDYVEPVVNDGPVTLRVDHDIRTMTDLFIAIGKNIGNITPEQKVFAEDFFGFLWGIDRPTAETYIADLPQVHDERGMAVQLTIRPSDDMGAD